MSIFIVILLIASTLITGLKAAWLWHKASEDFVVPCWGDNEPGDAQASMDGWIASTLAAFQQSAKLNRKAAVWTAAAVVSGTACSLFGLYMSLAR